MRVESFCFQAWATIQQNEKKKVLPRRQGCCDRWEASLGLVGLGVVALPGDFQVRGRLLLSIPTTTTTDTFCGRTHARTIGRLLLLDDDDLDVGGSNGC